jgi:phosphatidylglycerophosphatase C
MHDLSDSEAGPASPLGAHRPGSVPVFLFDLDGVLTHHDTMGALVVQRLLGRPLRLLAVAPVALAALAVGSRGELRPFLHRVIVRIAFAGLGPAEYRSYVADRASQLARRAGFRNVEAERALSDAAAEGDVVIVTAAERIVAESYLAAICALPARLLASELEPGEGPVRFADHNVGPRKLQRARDAGLDLHGATLVTDSLSDLPLARAVGRCVLVNASAREVAIARAACREVIPVRWR